MPRPLWTGSLSFGLVNVPVRLVSAVRDLDLHFRQLHAKDDDADRDPPRVLEGRQGGPLRGHRQRVRRRHVVLTDEELSAADPRKTRTIDIESFVKLDEIDPIYFDHPYFLVPAGETDGTVRAYRLLAGVMETDRARRARALRAAHEGVPRRDPRARQGADALHAALPRRGAPDQGHPGRRRADEAKGGRGGRQADRGALVPTGTRALRGRVPQAAAGDRRSASARAARSRRRRPTRRHAAPVPDLMAALEKSLAADAATAASSRARVARTGRSPRAGPSGGRSGDRPPVLRRAASSAPEYRRPARARQVAEHLVRERQVEVDAVGVDLAEAVGEVPEEHPQALVQPRLLGDRHRGDEPQRAPERAARELGAELRPGAARVVQRGSSTATRVGATTRQVHSTSSVDSVPSCCHGRSRSPGPSSSAACRPSIPARRSSRPVEHQQPVAAAHAVEVRSAACHRPGANWIVRRAVA